MDKPVELVPLLCLRCSTPVPAEAGEVAWVCAQCGQAMQLDERSGLAPVEIHYAAGIPAGKPGRPFWVADIKVTVQRQTYSGNAAQEAQAFWSAPRRFYIPAFDCPLDNLLTLGSQMLLQPPVLQDGPKAAFLPVTFSVDDASTLAEFIIVALEASRSDMLKELQFQLDVSPPLLWILPHSP